VLTERRALFHDRDLEQFWLCEEYRVPAAKAARIRATRRHVRVLDDARNSV